MELCELVRPRVAVPVHYEGWGHFQDGRAAIEAALAAASPNVADRVRWLPLARIHASMSRKPLAPPPLRSFALRAT